MVNRIRIDHLRYLDYLIAAFVVFAAGCQGDVPAYQEIQGSLSFQRIITVPELNGQNGNCILHFQGANAIMYQPEYVAPGGVLSIYESHLNDSADTIHRIPVTLPDSVSIDSRCPLFDVYSDKNLLVILMYKKLLLYNRSFLKRPTNVTLLRHAFNKIHRNRIGFLLSYCEYTDPMVDPCHFCFALTDSVGNIIREVQPSPPEGILLSILKPRSNIDCSQSEFAASDITKYSIKIYNMNFDCVATLERHPSDWSDDDHVQSYLSSLSEFENPVRSLKNISSNLKNQSTVVNLSFINDSSILVCWTKVVLSKGPFLGQRQLMFDVWVQRNHQWYLSIRDCVNHIPTPSERPTMEGAFPISNTFVCENGKIGWIERFPLDGAGRKSFDQILSDGKSMEFTNHPNSILWYTFKEFFN